MEEGALFVFDMNHPDIYPIVWGMKEPFLEEGDDFSLEIATSWHPRKRLGRALCRGWRRFLAWRVARGAGGPDDPH